MEEEIALEEITQASSDQKPNGMEGYKFKIPYRVSPPLDL